jgi:hypothetical protein
MKTVADTHARVATLRQSSPGSSDLKDASQALINADNALSEILARERAVDADITQARRELAAARVKSTGN